MSWMKQLSQHYVDMRQKYPEDKLMIVFDIDDTIVDIRLPLLYVLKKFDVLHKTSYFTDMKVDDIVFSEWRIEDWLPKISEEKSVQEEITGFVRENMWKNDTIFLSHRPFRGVLEIIRWLQIHDNTFVGLNTGRSNELRQVTLDSLNLLGQEYRVTFSDELLYTNPTPNSPDKDIVRYKAKGIEYFKSLGYRVIGFIDNEPANLKAVSDGLADPDILLLHADTMFATARSLIPRRVVVGEEYTFEDVIEPTEFAKHVSFVWNGVNTMDRFQKYQSSNVFWAELDVRKHPITKQLVLRHGSFDNLDLGDRVYVTLDQMLDHLVPLNRGIKLVLKEDGGLLKELLDKLQSLNIPSDHLWFDLIFEIFDEVGLKSIQAMFQDAVISTRVDFLVPLQTQFPDQVLDILRKLDELGINQFSISFNTYRKQAFIEKLEELDYDVNIRDVYSFEEFLQAILMLPRSVISSFDF